MKRFPYPLRVTIPLMLFLIVVSLGIYHLLSEVRYTSSSYEKDMRHRVALEGTRLSRILAGLHHLGNADEVENVLIKGQRSYGFRKALLFDENNKIIISSEDISEGNKLSLSPDAEIADLLKKTRESFAPFYHFSDDRMIMRSTYPVHLVRMRGDMSSRKKGVLYLEHDLSQGKKLAYMDALQSFYKLMAVLIVICFFVWGFFVITFNRRVNRLVDASRQFAYGDYATRARLNGSDELAYLGKAFDHMAGTISENTKALKESEERHRRLVEGLKEHFLYSRNTGGVFTYVSPTITRMLGYTQSEFKNHFTEFLTDNPINRDVLRLNERSAKGEPVPSYEVEAVSKSGERRWLQVSENPVCDEQGNVVAIEGIAHDITEKKRAEEELLKAKEKAEKATRLKDKFVALVVHDLRSPLTSLLMSLELVSIDKETPISPRHKEILNIGLRSGKNMTELIKELLDINRLQTGKMTPNITHVDVYDLALSMVENNRHIAEKKGISIVNEVPPSTRFYADDVLYSQVIMNLVSNAIKFCRKGDRITLFVPEGKSTTLVVIDTGVGISKNILSDIFRHEIKTSTRGTSGEAGTGLGLPLSHEIMKAHGGSLSVESTEGNGSAFYVHLPAACKDERAMFQLTGNMEKERLVL